ncbi:Dam family site-specific DNA-(adenine-N6)-methyltransferase [Bifidobacterium sp. ESL0732]|uniref:DNA adenine methylase n=1 Tax=Bifidobacterium sp. ESL0732 TaxID=2983222 RepID=UPI0023F6A7BC|nr:Dam family site-specific DNA-(adenine-N6)-methyltransferase [Bifidobacterium sp. ESL0732]WEV63478.1 Dam family site-specific DNA-(adenine-N6)-methyltransferase [Bifidobacterium sp. ESL0732]
MKVGNDSLEKREPKPFLRWAGGKRWLLDSLDEMMSDFTFKKYYEPFLGGGSVFFHLKPNSAFLSDLNNDLITTYVAVRDRCEEVINKLLQYKITEDDYYDIRASVPNNNIELAARFIYLNHTSYNGLYRVNKKGQYNVPYGKKDTVHFDVEGIRAANIALQGVSLKSCDYQDTINEIDKGDFVFLDPPYTVSHNHNGFIQYNKKLFSIDNQKELRGYIEKLDEKGAYFLLTNADHYSIREIFNDIGNRGPMEVKRFSGLGGIGSVRETKTELVFSNLPL